MGIIGEAGAREVSQPVSRVLDAAQTWTPAPGVTCEMLHGSLDGRLLVARVALAPGAVGPLEIHPDHVETIVPVLGAVSVAGDNGIRIEANLFHSVCNASDSEPAEYIAVMRRVRGN